MFEVELEPIIKEKWPDYRAIIIESDITTSPTSDDLWSKIEEISQQIRRSYELSEINKRSEIAAIRNAYKKFGKDPNRYRPSSDALCRRIVKDMPLYRTLNIIDLINYLSVKYGNSIGGFDADKIEGSRIKFGVGVENEPYTGIGRGELNITGMPVWRDSEGGFGTPTSDHERTKISGSTSRLLMTIHFFEKESSLEDILKETEEMLINFASAKNIKFRIILT